MAHETHTRRRLITTMTAAAAAATYYYYYLLLLLPTTTTTTTTVFSMFYWPFIPGLLQLRRHSKGNQSGPVKVAAAISFVDQMHSHNATNDVKPCRTVRSQQKKFGHDHCPRSSNMILKLWSV